MYYFTILHGPSLVIYCKFCIYDMYNDSNEMYLYRYTLIVHVLKCTSIATGTANTLLVV